jgi:hypothetical protein
MPPSRRQLMALSPEERALYKKWLRRNLVFYGAVAIMLIMAITGSRDFASPDNLAASDLALSTVAAAKR